jgi:hypothetical protein
LILPLGDSGLGTTEEVHKLIVKIATIIDNKICADQQVSHDQRLAVLRNKLRRVQLGFKVKVVSSWVGKNFRPFINILDALATLLNDLHNAGVDV